MDIIICMIIKATPSVSHWSEIFRIPDKNNISTIVITDATSDNLNKIATELHQNGIYIDNISTPIITDWAQVLIAVISVSVSFLALYFTIREQKERRNDKRDTELRRIDEIKKQKELDEIIIKQQQQSVKPYLSFEVDYNTIIGKFILSIVNYGIGPAFIQSFDIKVDNNKIDGRHNLHDAIEHLLYDYDLPFNIKCYFGIEGTAIATNQSRMLFDLEYTGDKETLHLMQIKFSKIVDELSRITYLIKYESLYGESFSEEIIA